MTKLRPTGPMELGEYMLGLLFTKDMAKIEKKMAPPPPPPPEEWVVENLEEFVPVVIGGASLMVFFLLTWRCCRWIFRPKDRKTADFKDIPQCSNTNTGVRRASDDFEVGKSDKTSNKLRADRNLRDQVSSSETASRESLQQKKHKKKAPPIKCVVDTNSRSHVLLTSDSSLNESKPPIQAKSTKPRSRPIPVNQNQTIEVASPDPLTQIFEPGCVKLEGQGQATRLTDSNQQDWSRSLDKSSSKRSSLSQSKVKYKRNSVRWSASKVSHTSCSHVTVEEAASALLSGHFNSDSQKYKQLHAVSDNTVNTESTASGGSEKRGAKVLKKRANKRTHPNTAKKQETFPKPPTTEHAPDLPVEPVAATSQEVEHIAVHKKDFSDVADAACQVSGKTALGGSSKPLPQSAIEAESSATSLRPRQHSSDSKLDIVSVHGLATTVSRRQSTGGEKSLERDSPTGKSQLKEAVYNDDLIKAPGSSDTYFVNQVEPATRTHRGLLKISVEKENSRFNINPGFENFAVSDRQLFKDRTREAGPSVEARNKTTDVHPMVSQEEQEDVARGKRSSKENCRNSKCTTLATNEVASSARVKQIQEELNHQPGSRPERCVVDKAISAKNGVSDVKPSLKRARPDENPKRRSRTADEYDDPPNSDRSDTPSPKLHARSHRATKRSHEHRRPSESFSNQDHGATVPSDSDSKRPWWNDAHSSGSGEKVEEPCKKRNPDKASTDDKQVNKHRKSKQNVYCFRYSIDNESCDVDLKLGEKSPVSDGKHKPAHKRKISTGKSAIPRALTQHTDCYGDVFSRNHKHSLNQKRCDSEGTASRDGSWQQDASLKPPRQSRIPVLKKSSTKHVQFSSTVPGTESYTTNTQSRTIAAKADDDCSVIDHEMQTDPPRCSRKRGNSQVFKSLSERLKHDKRFGYKDERYTLRRHAENPELCDDEEEQMEAAEKLNESDDSMIPSSSHLMRIQMQRARQWTEKVALWNQLHFKNRKNSCKGYLHDVPPDGPIQTDAHARNLIPLHHRDTKTSTGFTPHDPRAGGDKQFRHALSRRLNQFRNTLSNLVTLNAAEPQPASHGALTSNYAGHNLKNTRPRNEPLDSRIDKHVKPGIDSWVGLSSSRLVAGQGNHLKKLPIKAGTALNTQANLRERTSKLFKANLIINALNPETQQKHYLTSCMKKSVENKNKLAYDEYVIEHHESKEVGYLSPYEEYSNPLSGDYPNTRIINNEYVKSLQTSASSAIKGLCSPDLGNDSLSLEVTSNTDKDVFTRQGAKKRRANDSPLSDVLSSEASFIQASKPNNRRRSRREPQGKQFNSARGGDRDSPSRNEPHLKTKQANEYQESVQKRPPKLVIENAAVKQGVGGSRKVSPRLLHSSRSCRSPETKQELSKEAMVHSSGKTTEYQPGSTPRLLSKISEVQDEPHTTARHLLGNVDKLREKYLQEMKSMYIYRQLPIDISPAGCMRSILNYYQTQSKDKQKEKEMKPNGNIRRKTDCQIPTNRKKLRRKASEPTMGFHFGALEENCLDSSQSNVKSHRKSPSVNGDNLESCLNNVESRLNNAESRLNNAEARQNNAESRHNNAEARHNNAESRHINADTHRFNADTRQVDLDTRHIKLGVCRDKTGFHKENTVALNNSHQNYLTTSKNKLGTSPQSHLPQTSNADALHLVNKLQSLLSKKRKAENTADDDHEISRKIGKFVQLFDSPERNDANFNPPQSANKTRLSADPHQLAIQTLNKESDNNFKMGDDPVNRIKSEAKVMMEDSIDKMEDDLLTLSERGIDPAERATSAISTHAQSSWCSPKGKKQPLHNRNLLSGRSWENLSEPIRINLHNDPKVIKKIAQCRIPRYGKVKTFSPVSSRSNHVACRRTSSLNRLASKNNSKPILLLNKHRPLELPARELTEGHTSQEPQAIIPGLKNVQSLSLKDVLPRSGTPHQVLPRSGTPHQVLPRSGTPHQVLPRSGTPHQVLPRSGTPHQILPRSGTPHQVLPRSGTPSHLKSYNPCVSSSPLASCLTEQHQTSNANESKLIERGSKPKPPTRLSGVQQTAFGARSVLRPRPLRSFASKKYVTSAFVYSKKKHGHGDQAQGEVTRMSLNRNIPAREKNNSATLDKRSVGVAKLKPHNNDTAGKRAVSLAQSNKETVNYNSPLYSKVHHKSVTKKIPQRLHEDTAHVNYSGTPTQANSRLHSCDDAKQTAQLVTSGQQEQYGLADPACEEPSGSVNNSQVSAPATTTRPNYDVNVVNHVTGEKRALSRGGSISPINEKPGGAASWVNENSLNDTVEGLSTTLLDHTSKINKSPHIITERGFNRGQTRTSDNVNWPGQPTIEPASLSSLYQTLQQKYNEANQAYHTHWILNNQNNYNCSGCHAAQRLLVPDESPSLSHIHTYSCPLGTDLNARTMQCGSLTGLHPQMRIPEAHQQDKISSREVTRDFKLLNSPHVSNDNKLRNLSRKGIPCVEVKPFNEISNCSETVNISYDPSDTADESNIQEQPHTSSYTRSMPNSRARNGSETCELPVREVAVAQTSRLDENPSVQALVKLFERQVTDQQHQSDSKQTSHD